MKIRLLSIALITLILLSCFVGCDASKILNAIGRVVEEYATKDELDELPDILESVTVEDIWNDYMTETDSDHIQNPDDSYDSYDYDAALANINVGMGGQDFTVLCRNDAGNALNEMLREEDSVDPLESAVYQRNLMLAEKCNINYVVVSVPTSSLFETLVNDLAAGGDGYHVAMPNMKDAGALASKGCLRDFHDLPYVDLNAAWWDQGTALMSIGGKVFWMNGDVNYFAHDVTFLMMFSKRIANEIDIENLYDTVINQEWTLDVLSSYVERTYCDLNGDALQDESDRYGFLACASYVGNCMFYASGLKYIECPEDDQPYLCMTETEMLKAVDLADRLLGILHNNSGTYVAKNGYEDIALDIFVDDRGLFYIETASRVQDVKREADDFGLLPLPKYDRDQAEYSTFTHGISSTMVVPDGPQNSEELSKVLECMAILSGKHVIPAYYDQLLERKTVRDHESAGMLDIIFSNRTYDLAKYYELWLEGIFETAIAKGNNTFASTYQKNQTKSQKLLDKLMKQFDE